MPWYLARRNAVPECQPVPRAWPYLHGTNAIGRRLLRSLPHLQFQVLVVLREDLRWV